MEITKEEFADWQRHPITMAFMKKLLERREDGLQELANGRYADNQGLQNIAIGKINAFTSILELNYEEATNE